MGYCDQRHRDRVNKSLQRIHDPFDRWLKDEPSRVFLHLADQTLSFAHLGHLVDQVEAEMRADGVLPGDRVLIVAENCPEHAALILACSRIGAWSCGVNARMSPGEVVAFLTKADPRISYFTSEISPAAAAHALRSHARPSVLKGLQRSPVRAEALAEPEPLASQVAAIIFTSGTTGASKGVLMTHDGVLHFARVSAASRGLGPSDRAYAYLPMTHIFGLGTVLMASLHAGASLVMRTHFDPPDLLEALAHHKVSQLQGPPTLFARLLAYMEQCGISHPDAPHLRYVYTGAGPLDRVLKGRVESAFGLPLNHGYGLSEYAGSIHLTRMEERRDDTSAGFCVDGADLRIFDSISGQELAAGERGEIWLRGRGLMPGYFRDPAASAEVMRDGGWYATGDLGELHPDGALFVVGRLKEMIIRSGFNVYPGEVEAVLNRFPEVQRSAVVGRPESDGNEEIIAYVELRHGRQLDQTALRAHLSENLAPYKRPAHVQPVPGLPETSSGKILKRQLLEMYPPQL